MPQRSKHPSEAEGGAPAGLLDTVRCTPGAPGIRRCPSSRRWSPGTTGWSPGGSSAATQHNHTTGGYTLGNHRLYSIVTQHNRTTGGYTLGITVSMWFTLTTFITDDVVFYLNLTIYSCTAFLERDIINAHRVSH